MPKPKLLAVVSEQAAKRAHEALAAHQSPQPPGVVLSAAHVSSVELQALLTTEQAAAILGLAPATLANDRTTAEIGLPFVKLGGRVVRPAKVAA